MYAPYNWPFHQGMFWELSWSHTYGPVSPVTLLMNSSMRWPPSVSATRPRGTSTPASAACCSANQHAPEVPKRGQFCASMQPAGTASAYVIQGLEAPTCLPLAPG